MSAPCILYTDSKTRFVIEVREARRSLTEKKVKNTCLFSATKMTSENEILKADGTPHKNYIKIK